MRYVTHGYWVVHYADGDVTPLQGDAQASAETTADLSQSVDLLGAATGTAGAESSLLLQDDIVGAATATAAASADLYQSVDLSGDGSADSSTTADLIQSVDLLGDGSADSSTTADLITIIDLSGSGQAQSTATGKLSVLSGGVHKLTHSAMIDLYSVDLNSIGIGQVYYFHAGTDSSNTPIVYQGNTYTPWYIKITGLDKRGTGSSARPMAEIGNHNQFVTNLCRVYQDIVGATVRRRRTLASYILADLDQYHDEFYLIERRAEETTSLVKFELASPLDFLDKQLPGLLALATGCPHRYKSTLDGSGCSWPGTNSALWFDRFGVQVFSAGLDVCGKRISDCKLRFGATEPLDYGGNPGLGRNSA
jgi:lambda family phage minor tail protein L